ncbi:hypothetical protein [Jeotgalibacillus marinus]|uniref:Uncharacterized protein n=1 Tax=Jeotgalibacillus marinus TaxID=86667 RepID=A0ABV3Q6D4_9BACL
MGAIIWAIGLAVLIFGIMKFRKAKKANEPTNKKPILIGAALLLLGMILNPSNDSKEVAEAEDTSEETADVEEEPADEPKEEATEPEPAEEESNDDSEVAMQVYKDDVKSFVQVVLDSYDSIWEETWTKPWEDVGNGVIGESELMESMDELYEQYEEVIVDLSDFNKHNDFEKDQQKNFDLFVEHMTEALFRRQSASTMIWLALDDNRFDERTMELSIDLIGEGDAELIKSLAYWTDIKMHFDDLD